MSGVRAGAGTGPDVFTFGETMAALRGEGPLKLGGVLTVSVAGAESNVAVGLARLGHDASWAGAVGDDEAGELVLRTLRAEGVDVTGARRDPHAPTGLILFEPRLPEVTRVHYYRSGSAGSRVDAEAVARAFAATPPRLLHLTGVTPALGEAARAAWERVLRLAREHAVPVCLDVNHRSRLWSTGDAAAFLRPWVPYVDVLVASADELPVCLPPEGEPGDARAAAERLLRLGVPEVVVKLGADGATAHVEGGASWHRPAVPVRVVDTVGAGDAFVAGYLSALLDGADVPGRLERAVTTGAFAVASRGDWEGAPTRAELGLLGAADVLR
ncbi:sugar kinase [Streptomyces spectabilis]|uniref:2-dehydro-3-deoxygluconokinase n=2 Tax=Streptomyces spectabilis TaxID=68270 RepID=A0A7W8ET41_STRST|nr:sugar kinase [Streptomyces spectabilis]MBB5103121.1 2-dehydro-3-deoxygluconokinase [Streptomyces spectabilis]GGV14650.1 sugar kinase [Streptomyces spectabilis]